MPALPLIALAVAAILVAARRSRPEHVALWPDTAARGDLAAALLTSPATARRLGVERVAWRGHAWRPHPRHGAAGGAWLPEPGADPRDPRVVVTIARGGRAARDMVRRAIEIA